MKAIIHATSIIGCSISLMFCLLAVLVLSCYREKTRLLLIKQQQSITLVFINIVMLTGFQGTTSEALCQAATTLLHYFVLACFAWLTADQYFIFKSVVKTKPYVNFMKLFIAAWGFPVPFLIMQLLIGFLLNQKIGSVLYTCWGSDLVAITLLIPAGGLSIASITMLSITVKSVIKRPAPTTYTRRKTDEAIKYGIKTSSVMIFITVVVWIFAHLLFWYPENIDFQLIFALSTGLQGLFNFFFYCVFALELDIYVSDKLFSETDDVDEFARNTGSVKLSSINRQDIQNMESLRRPQKGNGNRPFFDGNQKLPPMIEEEPLSFHTGKSTPTITRRLSDPLPWYPPALSGNAKKPFFGPPEMVKREQKIAQRLQLEIDKGEKESYHAEDAFTEKEGMHYLKAGKTNHRNEKENDKKTPSHKNTQHETQKTSPPKTVLPNDLDSTEDYGVVLPEDDGRSYNRAFSDSSNTFDKNRSPPHPGFPSVDIKATKSVSSSGSAASKSRLRPRPSVPSLKFALNELESLFSNQDLISAADRRLSVQSDSRTFNAGPEGATSK